MENENPFCLKEQELVTFPPSRIKDDGEYLNFEHIISNQSNDFTSNKRRLIITTTSSDPVLIEFRPSLSKPLIDSLASHSIQCDIIKRECGDALQTIQQLKMELVKEKDEREKYALALTKFSDMEEQLELEKSMRSQECKKHDALVLYLQSQVDKQAEEIRRLWTENLTIESDDVSNIKSIETNAQKDVLETKQHILDLECQLAEELKQHKTTYTNQESRCDHLQSKINELEINQDILLHERDDLKLRIEELEKENLQYQDKVMLSTLRKDGDDKLLDYVKLQKDHDKLKEELEKLNNNYNRTSHKLRHNVSKRRRLEAESEGEKQQRLSLAAALYELENEIEATVLVIKSLQSTTCEGIFSLTSDLENFKMELEKSVDSNDSKLKSLICHNNDLIKPIDISEIMDSTMDTFKGIPNTKPIISKLTHEIKKLFNEISNVKVSMDQVLKTQISQARASRKEVATKLKTIEFEKEAFLQKSKVLDEENKSLEEENSRLQHEVSTLNLEKSKFIMEIKDLDKEIEDLQENAQNLREENRKLLKEAKWKSVGKQGGYQESLIVQEWETRLKKLEVEYEVLRHVKKDLVKDKRRLEDELNKAMEKGYKGPVGSEDQKLESDLHNMIQERNKLRKIKITLAIENVSLKESITELSNKIDVLQTKCECGSLPGWKEKVKKLEKDCEDMQNWKIKAKTLEIECKELHDNQMKVEGHEIKCNCKKNSTLNESEECKVINEVVQESQDIKNDEMKSLKEECKNLCECKLDFTSTCQKLQEKIELLNEECNILREIKEKSEHSDCNGNKVQAESFECKDNGDKFDVKEKGTTLNNLNTLIVENCNIQGLLETIANLKDENVKLCENHQEALDKQWNVLQVDLKAFEGKIEELENECESIRRDHLSSMVENSELARDKDKLYAMYNEQKYNNEILETAHECLQKNYEQKEAHRVKEQNDFHASIDKLSRQVLEIESSFCERLRQQETNYASCLQLKTIFNGLDTVTLKRQEYEILLAEKAILLQERDNTHIKLCNVEVQNIQLSASIECLQQELTSCRNKSNDEKEIGADILLAQDVLNLQSMVDSLEVDLKNVTFEKNRIFDINMSLKKELEEVHEVLSHREYENQRLNDTLEELRKRSSLEQIHSAASSLKEQLGKLSKEKDSIKEQLQKVIKEKEQLANVANERDNVIFLLKDEIKKLEKEREESLKIQLQHVKDDTMVESSFNIDGKCKTIVMERDNLKRELALVQDKLQSLHSQRLDVEDDQRKKSQMWQDKYEKSEEKCKRIEIELHNAKEALTMTKKVMQKDVERAIKDRHDFELEANKEIEIVQDELGQIKKSIHDKLENASKELNNTVEEKNKVEEELTRCKETLTLMQIENGELRTLVKEKDKVISTKYEIVNGQNILNIQGIQNDPNMGEDAKEIELNEIKSNNNILNDENLILLQEKERLFEEHNNLLEELSQFKKCDETKLGKKGKRQWNFKGHKEEMNILLQEKERLLTSEESLKKQILDLEENYTSINSSLINEKEALLESHVMEMTLLKMRKEEIEESLKHQIVDFEDKFTKLNCTLINEKEVLLESHVIEITLLKKEKEETEKSSKQQIVDLEEVNASLINEKEKLLKNHVIEITLLKKEKEENEEFSKQQIADLEGKFTKINYNLINEKEVLLESHVIEITLLKKRKEETEKSLKQQFVDLEEVNASLINEKEKLLENHVIEITLLKKEKEKIEESSKQQIADLEEKFTKINYNLINEKEVLLESHVKEINLLEKGKEETEKSSKQQFVDLEEVNASLINEKEKLLGNHVIEITLLKKEKEEIEESSKHQIADLEEKFTKMNASLINEEETLLETYVTEITLLKKEKEEIEIKLEGFEVQHDVLMKDLQSALNTNKEDLFLKQMECAKLVEDNTKLNKENSMLIQIKGKEKSDFITKVELMEKGNEESKNQLKEVNDQLSSLKSKVYELLSEKENLLALELCSRQQLDKQIVAQEQLQGRLEGEIIKLNQAKETLVQENNKLFKECEQHAQLQNEILSLLKAKETSFEEYSILSEEMMKLKMEKELLDEKYSTTLVERDQILASQRSQQDEVKVLNENLLSLQEQVINLSQRNKELEVELQNTKPAKNMQDQQTYTSNILYTNEVAISCNMDKDYENQVNVKFNGEEKELEVESLRKQFDFLKQQQDETIKERDNLALSLKESEQAHNNIVHYQKELETLKQKMHVFNQQYVQLSQERDNILQENTTFQQNIVDLQAKISSLKVEGDIMNSSTESEVTKHDVSKEKFQKYQIVSSVKTLKEQQIILTKENMEIVYENELLMKERASLFASISLLKNQHETKDTTIIEASLNQKFEELVQSIDVIGQSEENHNAFKVKLDNLKNTTISIFEKFKTSTKEKEKSANEISSLKKECQKLHMTLVSYEKDKETSMKKLLDSRSTFDRFVGEISRLQRELADVEMKLSHTAAEKENANIQIADLQIHLNNQQRMQHMPYTMEKVQTLEAQNRCLRMEKDVLEECLKKCSIEINESHLYKQRMPSMTNFNCMTQQPPPSQHHIHTSSQLYAIGRPPTSFLPTFHQQWPM